jgi:hypothetical protein
MNQVKIVWLDSFWIKQNESSQTIFLEVIINRQI